MKHKHLMACVHLEVKKCVYHVLENIYVKTACAVSGRRTDLWFSKDHNGVFACFSPFAANHIHFALLLTIFQSML